MKDQSTVTIKEIAAMTGVSQMTVMRNEGQWKLYKALASSYEAKPRLYCRVKVLVLLGKAGVELEPGAVAPS